MLSYFPMYGQDIIVIIWKVAFGIPWITYLFKRSADMVMYVWLSCNYNNIVIQANEWFITDLFKVNLLGDVSGMRTDGDLVWDVSGMRTVGDLVWDVSGMRTVGDLVCFVEFKFWQISLGISPVLR